MAIKINGDVVINNNNQLININSIEYGDSTIQTTAQINNKILINSAFDRVHTLDNPNLYGTSESDNFGRSVAISGNYAIVGADLEDDGPTGSNSGKAYIYNVTTGALVLVLNNPNSFGTSSGDWFGRAVAISGNYAIVNAYLEDDASGLASGKAYIFNVTTGALVHVLNNPNYYGTGANDYFGISVAIDGNYAIVGASAEDDGPTGSASGKAYIFNVTTGALVHALSNPNYYDTGASDLFGEAVAISGNYAIVGAYREDDGPTGSNSGKVYIFNVTTGALVHALSNPNYYGNSDSDQFGWPVAISGNYAIVGAIQEDDGPLGINSGKAYIFNVTTGALVHALSNPNYYGNSAIDNFGRSVSISGNYAIVGADGEGDSGGSNSGKAYIFNVTTGALVHALINPNYYGTSASDYFGNSVSISGNYAIVSAVQEDDASGTGSGKAYIFTLTDTSGFININSIKFPNGTDIGEVFRRLGKISAPGGALIHALSNPNYYGTGLADYFGYSVAISGNYAIVGAYQEDDGPIVSESGKAYIFNVTTGALVRALDNPNYYSTTASDLFGEAVAIAGNYAIVSAYNEDDATGANSGKAYIFNVTTGALMHVLNNPNYYGASSSDWFGFSVAIAGNYAIVGAHLEDDGPTGSGSGKAYIYNVTTGALVHALSNPNYYGTGELDRFGYSVAIAGNYAIVGAWSEDDAGGSSSGKAYIFNVTTGALVHALSNPNYYGISNADFFGYSVAISGNYAIVGAYLEDDATGNDSGKAYIFNVTTGALVHVLNNPNLYGTGLEDYFGYSVAIDDNYAIVGAYTENDATGTLSGKAYIFNVTTGALVHALNNPNYYGTSSGDFFGSAVAIDGNYAIVGAYLEDDGPTGSESGKAYIFSIRDLTNLDRLYTLVS